MLDSNRSESAQVSEVEQHSLRRSVWLHLLPGASIVSFYLLTAHVVVRSGFPSGLALLLGFVFVGMPLEMGIMMYAGKVRHGVFSLRGVVLYREPMPGWQYGLLLVLLLAFAFGALFAITPFDVFLARTVFPWLPQYLLPNADYLGHSARGAIIITLVAGLVVDGVVNPIVEELYFRGFLLPRISRLRWISPLLNASLFTLGHFWQPYNYPLIFVIQLALVYVVYATRNIYIGILGHATGNLIGGAVALFSFLAR